MWKPLTICCEQQTNPGGRPRRRSGFGNPAGCWYWPAHSLVMANRCRREAIGCWIRIVLFLLPFVAFIKWVWGSRGPWCFLFLSIAFSSFFSRIFFIWTHSRDCDRVIIRLRVVQLCTWWNDLRFPLRKWSARNCAAADSGRLNCSWSLRKIWPDVMIDRHVLCHMMGADQHPRVAF